MADHSNFKKYLALFFSTGGVGYIPLAPGTFGSLGGVALYIGFTEFYHSAKPVMLDYGMGYQQYSALFTSIALGLILALTLIGIWASRVTEEIHEKKDSQKIVVDEVIGQLIVFLFVPLELGRWLIVAGFLLFRVFDIWKPYPVKQFETLPRGIGVVADDIVAGVYAGLVLSVLYWVSVLN